MQYQIIQVGYFTPEGEEFETEEAAIDWALEALPRDGNAYFVMDTQTNNYVAIVFQGQEWRPS